MELKQKIILIQSALGIIILAVGYWYFESITGGQEKTVLYSSLFFGLGMMFSAFLKLMSSKNES